MFVRKMIYKYNNGGNSQQEPEFIMIEEIVYGTYENPY